jgi:hypothetical protein
MLFYVGAFITVLFGVDIAAQLLGNGPQAFIGGPIGALLFFLMYKLIQSQAAHGDILDLGHPDLLDQGHSTPPPLPPEISNKRLDDRPSNKWEQPAPSPHRQPSEKRRRRRQSRREPTTIVERLKGILRNMSG